MLDLKGIDYKLVNVLPGNQRLHVRLAGFRRRTVPALKLDGRRTRGSTAIAREWDALRRAPPLFPPETEARRPVEEAERWGDEEFQSVPRRILRWGLARDASLRQWMAEQDGRLPFAAAASHVTGPVSKYYARIVHADGE